MSDAIGDRCAIVLPSGREFSLIMPDAVEITLNAVARGLASQYRWCGFGKNRITVAEHCVQASQAAINRRFGPPTALAALMHDAHEFILRDLPPGLKNLLPGYKSIAARIQRAIEQALCLAEPTAAECAVVRDIDMALRVAEVREGYAPSCTLGIEAGLNMHGLPVFRDFGPDEAELAFVEQYRLLRRDLQAQETARRRVHAEA